MTSYQSEGRRPPGSGRTPTPGGEPLFNPQKPLAELLDGLAEQQAEMMPEARGRYALKSSQLRRFFGDVKDLYRRLERGADYETKILPMFKTLRSKASYAWRGGRDSKIPKEFHDFIDNGVRKVQTAEHFRAFVQHFEAVVGFLYGHGKVGK
ncbi:MAG: type III-A CRISPR-associated protein Csm2 [Planctomycetota bacterium]